MNKSLTDQRTYSVLSATCFALGTYSITVAVVRLIIALSLGVSSLEDAISTELQLRVLKASTFSAPAAAGLALVLGVSAMVRYRRKSVFAILGASFGIALLAWVVLYLILFID